MNKKQLLIVSIIGLMFGAIGFAQTEGNPPSNLVASAGDTQITLDWSAPEVECAGLDNFAIESPDSCIENTNFFSLTWDAGCTLTDLWYGASPDSMEWMDITEYGFVDGFYFYGFGPGEIYFFQIGANEFVSPIVSATSSTYECGGTGDVYYDCDGVEFTAEYLSWLGDTYCDDGTYGLNFLCDEWGWDCNDCPDYQNMPDPNGWCNNRDANDGMLNKNSKEVIFGYAPENTNSRDLLGYNIYQGGTFIGSSVDLTYTIDGLNNGDEYCFTVTAEYTTIESDHSNEACAIPGLPAPTDLTYSVSGQVNVNLTWTAPGLPPNPDAEGFENGTLPAGWTAIDNDGDGFNWINTIEQGYGFDAHTGEGCMTSASYDNDTGALTPDNYLITSAIEIGTGAVLTYWHDAQDSDWADEHYYVKVSTSGTNPSDFTDIVYEGVTPGEWAQVSVDLSAYAGQMVFLAWHHADVTDMFWMKIDDVAISGTNMRPVVMDFEDANDYSQFSSISTMPVRMDVNATVEEQKDALADYINAQEQSETTRDFQHYNIYRDGALLGTSLMTDFADLDLANGNYEYYVTAQYDSGESSSSNTVNVSINYDPNQTVVSLYILLDNYPAETTWDLVDASGLTVDAGGPYAEVAGEVFVDWSLAAGNYIWTIYDAWGDGICCAYGEGMYELSTNGEVFASGGEFTTEESVFFTVEQSGPIEGCMDPNAMNYDPEAEVPCEDCCEYADNYIYWTNSMGAPGGVGSIELALENIDQFGGLQFTANDYEDYLTFTNVEPIGRAEGWVATFNENADGLIVILYNMTGAVIEPGDAPILRFDIEISETVEMGQEVLISFSDVVGSDPMGNSVSTWYYQGGFLASSGLLGDLTQDGNINVLDVVRLISIALEQWDPTDYEIWAGDLNGDGALNVLDIVQLVQLILSDGLAKAEDATSVDLYVTDDAITIKANGALGGIQFDLDNPNALISVVAENDELAVGDNRALLIAWDGAISTTSINLTEMVEITDVIVANTNGESVDVEIHYLPTEFALAQNYPNPFNPSTVISYQLPVNGDVQLAIYNIAGQLIETLVSDAQDAGYYSIEWNGSGYASGVYFYQLNAGTFSETNKMVLMK